MFINLSFLQRFCFFPFRLYQANFCERCYDHLCRPTLRVTFDLTCLRDAMTSCSTSSTDLRLQLPKLSWIVRSAGISSLCSLHTLYKGNTTTTLPGLRCAQAVNIDWCHILHPYMFYNHNTNDLFYQCFMPYSKIFYIQQRAVGLLSWEEIGQCPRA